MKLSFKDYTLISDAFAEAQLDEGKIWDAIKAKLGGKASDEEVEAELERLKKTDKTALAKIKDTAASRDFHKRKAAQHAAAAAKTTQPTRQTVPNTAASFRSKSINDMKAGERRAVDRNPFGESLNEAKEYRVEYTTKLSNADSKVKVAKIKAQDVAAVREKFKRDFHGMKLLTIKPA